MAERALASFGETNHQRNPAMLRASYGLVLLDGDPAEPERAHEVLLDARVSSAADSARIPRSTHAWPERLVTPDIRATVAPH
ncbi:hypothetical protein [Nonomuraea sp. NPDC049400]|uniref:hypothetical protein n=1 Tax=Nonomuraea sp. NPDC049400 TaxID=3364352 RepID=UPI00379DDA62